MYYRIPKKNKRQKIDKFIPMWRKDNKSLNDYETFIEIGEYRISLKFKKIKINANLSLRQVISIMTIYSTGINDCEIRNNKICNMDMIF